MVRAYHVVFTAYGFWLPNDPRGSYSDFVAAWELFRYGPATKTDVRHSVAGKAHDRRLRMAAKTALKYPPVQFTGLQARAIGEGFKRSANKGKVAVHACAILPDHVHLVIGRHRCKVETVVNFFKGEATRELLARKLHPFQAEAGTRTRVPSCWAAKLWKVYLGAETDIHRAIRYVQWNPAKEHRPPQNWSFVTPAEPPASHARAPCPVPPPSPTSTAASALTAAATCPKP